MMTETSCLNSIFGFFFYGKRCLKILYIVLLIHGLVGIWSMTMEKEQLLIYTEEIAIRAGEKEAKKYAAGFVENIMNECEILDEYLYYLNTGSFLCKYVICGYTIADIIIWQMDHFKALLDDHTAMNKGNEYRMVLEGFATMMKMKKNPEPYVAKMQSTTGTDFVEKY